MMKQRKLYSLTLGAVLLAGSDVTLAQQIEQGFYIAPSLGYYFYDSDNDNNAKDAPLYGLSLGLQLHKNFALEASYFRAETEVDPKRTTKAGYVIDDDNHVLSYQSGDDLTADIYRLDAIFSLGSATGISPFIAVGYTKIDSDPEIGDSDDMMDLALGAKYAITPALFVKGDVRTLHSWDNEDTDYSVGLSIGYLFGKAAGTAPVEPKPGDSDGDGVTDGADLCPDTPAGASVDKDGCPLEADADRDGVADSRDTCPDTPEGSKVDEKGCPIGLPGDQSEVSIELEVLFDSNKAVVKPEYLEQVKKVADFMRQYPYTTAVIEGHTDSRGSNKLNKRLSQRRAEAVREVLVSQLGVEASRLTAVGYGEERPLADNTSEAGRKKNRRVVAVIKANVKKEGSK